MSVRAPEFARMTRSSTPVSSSGWARRAKSKAGQGVVPGVGQVAVGAGELVGDGLGERGSGGQGLSGALLVADCLAQQLAELLARAPGPAGVSVAASPDSRDGGRSRSDPARLVGPPQRTPARRQPLDPVRDQHSSPHRQVRSFPCCSTTHPCPPPSFPADTHAWPHGKRADCAGCHLLRT